MSKPKHHKKSRFSIAQRIAILFTLAMLVLIIVIGAAFTVIFRNRAKEDLKESSRETAVVISNLMSKTLTMSQSQATMPPYQRPADGDDFGRLPGQYSDFWINEKTLIAFINNLTSSEVWIIDTNLNMLSSTANADISQETIRDVELAWIDKIMSESGYFIYTEDFSRSLGDSYFSVGVPVYANNGNKIVGAVLVHASMDSIDHATSNGLIVLGASSVVALMVGLIVAWIIAKIITKPLYQIRNTALMISEGDYAISTGIHRRDEIGELAETLDEMSKKLEAAEEESQKLERLRRDFISNISHELRTPVTVMRSSLEALCEGVVTEEAQVEEYHRQMLGESVYLQRMVNDLLDLSRLQNADFKMNIGLFNLYDCLSDAVRSARRIASQKNKTVEFEYDTTIFTITGDYDRIRQLFMIVLDNAVKFTAVIDESVAPSGDVMPEPVRVRFAQGVVSITNTGSEIKPEDIPFIFDRFFKSHSEENKEGTGLGLAIAKQIALRHGIGVKVLSRNMVTTFLFEFQMVSGVDKEKLV